MTPSELEELRERGTRAELLLERITTLRQQMARWEGVADGVTRTISSFGRSGLLDGLTRDALVPIKKLAQADLQRQLDQAEAEFKAL